MQDSYFWYQINLSFLCNFRCSYCYVEEKRTEFEVMSPKSMAYLLDFTRRLVDQYGVKELRINFLGGEPLLVLPQLIALSKYLRKVVDCSFRVFTNGSILNESKMKFLKDEGIFVELSINRTIRENLYSTFQLISKYQRFVRIALVIDDYNLVRLSGGLLDWIYRNGGFAKLALENQGFLRSDYIEKATQVVDKAIRLSHFYLKSSHHIHTLFDKIDPSVNPKNGYVYGRNMLCFDPDGRVRVMNSVPGVYLGKLGDGLDYVNVMESMPNWRVNLPRWIKTDIKNCEECEVGDICQGGYPAPKWLAYKRFDLPSPYCKLFKHIVPKLVGLFNEKKKDQDFETLKLEI